MRALIVIVNYRTAGLAIECLRSLAPEVAAEPDTRVIVVDNDSGDYSVERLAAATADGGWTAWTRILPAPRNGGFAYGNNVGIRAGLADASPPDCVWLLNPDTRVRPGARRSLLDFLAAHPRVGIVGSRLEDPAGSPECSAHRALSLLSEFDTGAQLPPLARCLRRFHPSPLPRHEPHPCDWVSGASLMVRRSVLEAVGLMDEAYFLYFEELDFCERVRRAGWQIWHVPTSRVVHLEAAATGVRKTRRTPAYWFASRRRYFVQNRGRVYALAADLARLAGIALGRVPRLLTRRPPQDPPRFFRDLAR